MSALASGFGVRAVGDALALGHGEMGADFFLKVVFVKLGHRGSPGYREATP
jgi:hypothetical protein